MKKLILTFLIILILAIIPMHGTFAATVSAGTCGNNLTWDLDDAGTLTISGTGAMYDYSSSSVFPWYSNRANIKRVVIEKGVTSIGSFAFYGCSSLTSIIIIPDSLTNIGSFAFYGCSRLTSITIPNGVTSIDYYAFYGCSSLTSITIPNSVTSIGHSAFRDCIGLTRITIPNSVTWIDTYAFCDCSRLTSITIPDGVTSIGNRTFKNCSGLTSITIPNSVTNIDYYAFYGCSMLEDVYYTGTETEWADITIDDGNEYLSNATIHCNYVPTVIIAYGTCGNNLTWTLDDAGTLTISGTGAMYNYPDSSSSFASPWCNSANIKQVVIEKGVTSIGSYAFYGCSRLTSITIPDGVTSIGITAFYACSRLTSITIPNGVTSIASYAFYGCSSLTSITIPDSVTSIGRNAFEYCSTSGDVFFSGTKKQWDAISVGSDNSYLTSATIHCKYIITYDYAANGGTSASKVTDTVYGGEYADLSVAATKDGWEFVGWNTDPDATEALSSYVVNADVTLYAIWKQNVIAGGTCGNNLTWTLDDAGMLTISGTGAMYGYSSSSSSSASPWYSNRENIKQVVIEKGVTRIGSCAFHGCSRLTSIAIPNSVIRINNDAFYGCRSLTSITIPDGVTGIGSSAFRGCSGLTSITIPDSVTSIGSYAFYDCSSLTSITIPDSVTSIDDLAFAYCSRLTSITIPCSVTSVDGSAFSGCSSLTNILVDETNENYSSATGVLFSKNKSSIIKYPEGKKNTYYTIPNSVTSIGGFAFAHCSSLTSINIPDSVTSIGSSAFLGCSSLTSITIPNGVTSIASYAFYGCSSLTSITIPNSVTNIDYYAFRDCSSLRSITIPNSVTNIDYYAFYGCSMLEDVYYTGTETEWADITIDDGNEYLSNATIHCNYVPTVIIASGTCGNNLTWTLDDAGMLTISGTGAMYDYSYSSSSSAPWYSDRTNIKQVVIGKGVTTVGAYAFYDCKNIESISIADSITSIGEYAFYRCYSITDILIPEGVLEIGAEAFFDCTSLEKIFIPSTVTNMNNTANIFINCNSLISINVDEQNLFFSSIDGVLFNKSKDKLIKYPANKKEYSYSIPDGVLEICEDSFWDCTNLTEVIISEGVLTIDHQSFKDCVTLETVMIPSSVSKAYRNSFLNCPKLKKYIVNTNNPYYSSIDGVLFDKNTKTLISYPSGKENSIYIVPNNVLGIDGYSFNNCPYVTHIEIPHGVEFISEFAFRGCSSLELISVDENNPIFSDVNGVLFNKDKSEVLIYPQGRKEDSYAIPSYVNSIRRYAFADCTNLKNISIPSGIPTIPEGCFDDCENLIGITLPNGVTTIKHYAFNGCKKLKYIVLPTSITDIEWSIVDSIRYQLSDILYAGTESEWNNINIGSSNRWFTEATIHYNSTKAYIITYNAENASNIPTEQIKIGEENTTISKTIPIRFPYTFLGWGLSATTNTVAYLPGDSYSIDENLSLYALWSLALDKLSGSFPITTECEITKGGTIKYLEFTPDITDTYTLESSLSSGDTYGYLYTADGKRLSYDDDSGDGSNFKVSYELIAGTTYYFGVKYYSSSKTGIIPVKLTKQHTPCTVTYSSTTNGAGSATKTTDTVYEGEKADLTVVATRATAPGGGGSTVGTETVVPWEFLGWNTDQNATEALEELIVTSDVTLYPIFKKELKFNFYHKNNELLESKTIAIYNSTNYAKFTMPTFETYLDWQPVEWCNDRYYSEMSDPVHMYEMGVEKSFGVSVDFYARYKRTTSLSYEMGGYPEDISPYTFTQYYYGSGLDTNAIVMLPDVEVLTGEPIFNGWAKNSLCGDVFKAEDRITVTEDTVMYALWEIATPVITVSKNNMVNNVSISCTTNNTAIYYTIDGSEPNESSALYTEPFELLGNDDITIKVVAIREGYDASEVSTKAIELEQLSEPMVSIPDGFVKAGTKISLFSDVNADIYYTTDGSTPTKLSNKYHKPIPIDESMELLAVAIKDGMKTSDVVMFNYSVIDNSIPYISITSSKEDDVITAIVNISENSKAAGGSFNLIYDNTVLELIEKPDKGSYIKYCTAFIKENYSDNTIRVSWANIEEMSDAGEIIIAKFRIIDSEKTSTTFVLEKVKLSDDDANKITVQSSDNIVMLSVKNTEYFDVYETESTVGDDNKSLNVGLIKRAEEAGSIITAIFSDKGQLLQWKPATIVDNQDSYTITLDKILEKGQKVKVFVWNSLSNLKPISDVEEFIYE